MSATRVFPRITSMFSSFTFVEGRLKFAEPLTTIGSLPSGSISMNFVWMYCTWLLRPSRRRHLLDLAPAALPGTHPRSRLLGFRAIASTFAFRLSRSR